MRFTHIEFYYYVYLKQIKKKNKRFYDYTSQVQLFTTTKLIRNNFVGFFVVNFTGNRWIRTSQQIHCFCSLA